MKILIIDPINSKYSHAAFNSTFIEAICKTNIFSSIGIFLEKQQLELDNIKTNLQHFLTIREISLPTIQNNITKFGSFKRFFHVLKLLLQNIYKSKPDVIFFLAADNLVIPIFLLIFTRINNSNIFVVLHNNVENSKTSSIKNKLWKMVLDRGVTGIVLSQYLKKSAQLYFKNEKNIQVILHPTYAHLLTDHRKYFTNKLYYDFLLLGRHSNYFYKNNFSDIFFKECLKFKCSEKITILLKKSTIINDDSIVKIEGYEFPMSEYEYWQKLSSTKFLIIPPDASNRITASGVHIDAITMGVPVLAPNIGVFKENVPISSQYLLYDENTIGECISYALNTTVDEYRVISNDILKKADELSLENTSKGLKKLFISAQKKG